MALAADALLKKTRVPWRGKAVLVEVYLATQRYDEALAVLREHPSAWQASEADHFAFHTQQGLALKGRGRFVETTASLLKAVSLAEEMRRRLADRLTFFGSGATRGPLHVYVTPGRGLTGYSSQCAPVYCARWHSGFAAF